ncbi:MAG: aspartate kinase, partial [Lachnospiraceae bacterium]|nr:aspartate kinase [Lachnospiraceae bacterium]
MEASMNTIVCKFGGTSLADASQIMKAADIVRAEEARRFVVVSAPGKRYPVDVKITDMLYKCYELAASKKDFRPLLHEVGNRFREIVQDLGVSFDLDSELELIRNVLQAAPQRDYAASRGEYLNAKILAAYLQFPFVDPADCVRFTEEGDFDEIVTDQLLSAVLSALPNAVIAGFYGARPSGAVQTFSRGGSDVTGAIVAAAIHADLYENWTDVSGMLAADPRIVKEPRVIDVISYRELRILSYMGASVLHTDAVLPVRRAGIPINIRNTNSLKEPGTMIVPDADVRAHAVTGVAGRKGLSVVQ